MAKNKWLTDPSYTRFGDYLFRENTLLDGLQIQPNGCITWQRGCHIQGYGMMGGFRISDKKRIMQVVHRVAMMFKLKRPLHHDEFVIHTCNDQLCANPRHLVLGDYYVKDKVMVQKGHNAHRVKGARPNQKYIKQKNRKYKRTDEEIIFMRTNDTRDIAKRYNITRTEASKWRYNAKTRYLWLKEGL